jgi:hypothetical protein
MDTFRWLAVVLSTMLGLGIARILSGFVSAFKMRRRVRLDWLPLLLGGVILAEIVQFWWALAELLHRAQWTAGDFTFLLVLVMLLFLAAALIMPADNDLAEGPDFFERDGRWALLVLALFHVAAILANLWFWQQSPVSLPTLPIAVLAAASLTAAITTRRRLQETMAVVYVACSVAAAWADSPLSY